MMNAEELCRQQQLLESIDWQMTPEKAADMYLEWGSGWSRGHDFVSSAHDESVYFVLFDWETPPQVTLIRRNMAAPRSLPRLKCLPGFSRRRCVRTGGLPGGTVHRMNQPLEVWLRDRLAALQR